jgi:hypothetical protein
MIGFLSKIHSKMLWHFESMEIHLVKRKKSFVAENVNGPIVYPIKPDP